MSTTGEGQVVGFFHAGVTVSDMEDALRFFRDALGLEVVADSMRVGEQVEPLVGVSPDTMRVVFLSVPGSEAKIELFEYAGVEQFSAAEQRS